VRFEVERDAFPLENRQQRLHRPPELRFAFGRTLRSAIELGVHDRTIEFDRDLDGALPVAHRRLALVFVRTRPAVEWQQRRELNARLAQRRLELGHPCAVGAWVEEERYEILAG